MAQPSKAIPRVLVADEDRELAFALADSFAELGYRTDVTFAAQHLAALLGPPRESTAGTRRYDLVVSDARIWSAAGFAAHQQTHPLPRVVLLNPPDAATRTHSADFFLVGVAVLVQKPFDVDDLLVVVLALLPTVSANGSLLALSRHESRHRRHEDE